LKNWWCQPGQSRTTVPCAAWCLTSRWISFGSHYMPSTSDPMGRMDVRGFRKHVMCSFNFV
jgi:hypothetical protein